MSEEPALSLFFTHISVFFIKNYFSVSIIFQTNEAKAAPTNGPTMKIQRLASAVPPWKIAGAIERAGFTDVPV